MKKFLPRPSCSAIVAVFFLSQPLICALHAEILGTDQIIQPNNNKQTINAALLREDVRALLLENGVHIDDIKLRLNQLTDSELAILADEFKNLPAAGSPTMLLFLPGPVMLMLELTGTTDMSTTF